MRRCRPLGRLAPALLAALSLGLPALHAADRASPRSTPLEKRVETLARAFPGLLGVAATNLDTKESVAWNADTRFPTASLIKTTVMVEAYHRFAEGTLAKDTLVTLGDADRAGDEPVVLNQLHAGLALTVKDLVTLMIAWSDNTATNMLIRLVGTAGVDARIESYGLRDTKLFRPTFRDGHADVHPELEKEFGLGMTTPREMARLFELLAEGRVVSRAASDEMLSVLELQFDRQMIPRSLPFERDRIRVASKTGWDEEKLPDANGLKGDIRTDVAYVRAPHGRWVIVICARRVKDKRPGADNAALTTGARISRLVYDAWNRAPRAGENGR